MRPKSLTVIILTKNSESSIATTLASLEFVQEIVVIDDGSSDTTVKLCRERNVRVIEHQSADFSEKRTFALFRTATPWVLYLDADETVTKELRRSIERVIEINAVGAYRITRRNFFLGKEMYPDITSRLFHRSIISGWHGKIHESPVITVEPKLIEGAIIHHTHRSISSMLYKTNEWSEYEAELRLEAHHPAMAEWRLLRIALTVFWDQFIRRRVGQYGREGVFEGYFQIIDKLIVFTKLWERQQKAES